MQYLSKGVLVDMLDFVRHQALFIQDTTKTVSSISDFIDSQSGMILYNSTCMCLQTIGETLRKIDELTEKRVLPRYSQIHWRSIFGLRNIISHEYSAADPEKIFNTIKSGVPTLIPVIEMMLSDVKAGKFDSLLEDLAVGRG